MILDSGFRFLGHPVLLFATRAEVQ